MVWSTSIKNSFSQRKPLCQSGTEDLLTNLMKGDDHLEEEPSQKRKGGFITIPFIIANESFEKVASYGLITNMILYLMNEYKMSLTKGQNVIYIWQAATNFLPIVGAFVADSLLGRFLTIVLGSLFSLSGMILLWVTALIAHSNPLSCALSSAGQKNCDDNPTTKQYVLLASAFVFMSIGTGGVRTCSQAFGADQLVAKISNNINPNPNNGYNNSKKFLESFFNWYYACGCFSVVLAFTVIVYVQDHMGWRIGFALPAILMFFSILFFIAASPFYVMNEVKKSLITSLVQVLVAAFRNRKYTLPVASSSTLHFYQEKDSTASVPSHRLRFLNKACVIQDPNEDLGPDGLPTNPWKLCTVEEVEQLKSLIRILPIWSTGVIMSIHTSQPSLVILQATTMDRHVIGSKFQIPAGSFNTFIVIVIVIWVPIYDRLLLPLASKISGKRVQISVKLRMGIGLFCAFLSMLVAGIVESFRRNRAVEQGFIDDPSAVIQMSALWLIPQHIFSGLAEAFTAISQTEFYYTELSNNMSSIATCLFTVGTGVANLLASLIMNVVDDATKRGGNQSWVSSNVNRGHYDYYYWFLAFLGMLNVLYYMVCSWSYGPVKEVGKNEHHDKEWVLS